MTTVKIPESPRTSAGWLKKVKDVTPAAYKRNQNWLFYWRALTSEKTPATLFSQRTEINFDLPYINAIQKALKPLHQLKITPYAQSSWRVDPITGIHEFDKFEPMHFWPIFLNRLEQCLKNTETEPPHITLPISNLTLLCLSELHSHLFNMTTGKNHDYWDKTLSNITWEHSNEHKRPVLEKSISLERIIDVFKSEEQTKSVQEHSIFLPIWNSLKKQDPELKTFLMEKWIQPLTENKTTSHIPFGMILQKMELQEDMQKFKAESSLIEAPLKTQKTRI